MRFKLVFTHLAAFFVGALAAGSLLSAAPRTHSEDEKVLSVGKPGAGSRG